MVDVRAEVGQLDEILEVFQGGFPASAFPVLDVGRTVHRGEDHAIVPDQQVVIRVASELREVTGGLGNVCLDHSGFEESGVPFHFYAVVFEDLLRLLEIKIHADLGQDFHRFLMD